MTERKKRVGLGEKQKKNRQREQLSDKKEANIPRTREREPDREREELKSER